MRTTTTVTILFASFALAACGKTEPPAASRPNAAPASTSVSHGANATGVAECDDFLAKYEACLAAKVPDAARGALKQSLEATRASWEQALASPGGREALRASCETARSAARPSLQAYGCGDF